MSKPVKENKNAKHKFDELYNFWLGMRDSNSYYRAIRMPREATPASTIASLVTTAVCQRLEQPLLTY